jgi:hypothetical protein
MAQRSESPQLDQAVVGAANFWRFAPPRWDSQPVAVSARVEIRYNCFSVEFSRLGEISSNDRGRGNIAKRVNDAELAVRRFIEQLQSTEGPFGQRTDAGLQRLTAAARAWGSVRSVKWLSVVGEPDWRTYTIEPKDRLDPLESSVTVRWGLYRVEHDDGSSLMKLALDGSGRVWAAKAEVISPNSGGV